MISLIVKISFVFLFILSISSCEDKDSSFLDNEIIDTEGLESEDFYLENDDINIENDYQDEDHTEKNDSDSNQETQKLQKEIWYDKDGKEYKILVYTYNDARLLYEKKEYIKELSNNYLSRCIYTYNSDNLPTKETCDTAGDIIISDTKYTYSFDQYSNITTVYADNFPDDSEIYYSYNQNGLLSGKQELIITSRYNELSDIVFKINYEPIEMNVAAYDSFSYKYNENNQILEEEQTSQAIHESENHMRKKWQYDSEGRPLVLETWDDFNIGIEYNICVWQYDTQGNTTYESCINNENEYLHQWNMTYNENNLLTTKEGAALGLGNTWQIYTYEYNDAGLLSYSTLNVDNNFYETFYTYDNRGNNTSLQTYLDGDMHYEEIYQYNDMNDCIYMNVCIEFADNVCTNHVELKTIYIYDSHDRQTSFTMYERNTDEEDWTFYTKEEYTYDSEGRLIKKIRQDEEENKITLIEELTYDDEGNVSSNKTLNYYRSSPVYGMIHNYRIFRYNKGSLQTELSCRYNYSYEYKDGLLTSEKKYMWDGQLIEEKIYSDFIGTKPQKGTKYYYKDVDGESTILHQFEIEFYY